MAAVKTAQVTKSCQLQSLGTAISLLDSEKNPEVLEALITIRKRFIKEKDGIARFRQHGGLKKLLELVQNTNKKVMDVALSILGNCCMEEKTRKDVLRREGLEKLGKIIENVKVGSIQHRAVRTIANLAIDDQCRKAIYDVEGLTENITKLLKDADDPECQQTYLRALRLMCGNESQTKSLLNHEALRLIGETLKSELPPVYTGALKTMSEFTKFEYSNEMARQLLLSDVPATLLKLTMDDNITIRETSLKFILAFCKHPELRAGLGSAGAITMFKEKIDAQDVQKRDKYPLINALCLCCHEAVNRIRVREAKGLELLLKLLKDDRYNLIHNRLISCLICFLYDETGFKVFLNNGIVSILLKHLARVGKVNVHSQSVCSDITEVQNDEKTPENTKEAVIEGELQRSKSISGKPSNTADKDDSNISNTKKVSETIDLKRSFSCPSFAGSDDTDNNKESEKNEMKSKTVKYSMDSPTYQAISDFMPNDDNDYFSGPKNIAEAQQYFMDSGGSVSPWSYTHGEISPYRSPSSSIFSSPSKSPARTGPYSPLSVCSVAMSTSPETSPNRLPSPSASSLSPASSALWSSPSIKSTASLSPLADAQAVPSSSQNGQWSPLASPFHMDSPVFVGIGSPMWGSIAATTDESNEAHYSSSDDDNAVPEGNLGENVDLSETCLTPLAGSVLNPDPLFLDVSSTSSADSTFKVPETSSTESPRRAPSGIQGPHTQSNIPASKLSSQQKLKIKNSVEKSSASTPTSPGVLETIISKAPLYPKEEEDVNPELPKLKDPIRVTENNILVLLSRISYMDDPSEHMINHECLSGLLNYVLMAANPFPRCSRILARLTKNAHCFQPLIVCLGPSLIQEKLSAFNISQLMQKVVIEDNEVETKVVASTSTSSPPRKKLKMDGSHSKSLLRLTKERLETAQELGVTLLINLSLVGESRFGRGLLSHILLTQDEDIKIKCAVALAYIVRSRSLQRQMMIQHKALDYLCSALKADNEADPVHSTTVQTSAVQSVLFLVEELKIEWPKLVKKQPERNVDPDAVIGPSYHDVKFVMDDGSHVTGNRALLSTTSTVFAAMLDGHYSESVQNEITIPHANTKAFQLLMKYLHGCDIKSTVEAFQEDSILDILMKTLVLSDRYMLDSLKTELSTFISTQWMKAETFNLIFEVAAVHRCDELVQSCIVFALVGQTHTGDASDLVKQLFSGPHAECAVGALNKLIISHLNK